MTKPESTKAAVVDVAYEGDYAVLHLTDTCVSASIQFNSVQEVIELDNRLIAVIDRWTDRDAEMRESDK